LRCWTVRAAVANVARREGSRMIKAIKFVSIPVRDQDASLKFFTEKLGFRVLTDQPYDDKQRWIELRIGNAQTGLVLFKMDDEQLIGRGFHGSLVCDKLEQTYEELLAKGVEFVTPPTKESWGSFAIFKDIDGNRFVMSAA
jgi:catechol 2,3-dioxygenase-like lactoylglutathione lyase family enzyme